MNIYQPVAQLFQIIQIDGRIVYECPRFAVCPDLASQDTFIGIILPLPFIKKLLQIVPGKIENTLDGAFLLILLDKPTICTLSQNQRQGTQDNRFSGPGFTGNYREAFVKIDLERIYQRVILYC